MLYGQIFVVVLATSTVLTRDLKQAETVRPCGKQMHQCRDGSCIPFHAVCDGMVDCGDGSDETHALCRGSICQDNWFRCTYGACVDGTAPCNGVQECADNSDELQPKCRNEILEHRGYFKCKDGTLIPSSDHCDGQLNCPDGSDETVSACAHQQCISYYFQCAYGACVDHGADCNGTVECADGSDESDELCGYITDTSTKKCQDNWFRCTYGACVDGTAPCNGVQECADNSDELQPKCRNEILEHRGYFKCKDGTLIPSSDHCDGHLNCPDGSDETVSACAHQQCISYYFQCAYGACVDHGADCNGTVECADGSDESDELCGYITDTSTKKPVKRGRCILPRLPEHGSYNVVNAPTAVPGQALEFVQLNISCNSGYGLVGNDAIFCYDGWWSNNMPKCGRYCKLNQHPSVIYRCLVNSTNPESGYRDCKENELSGTLVKPECSPSYYYSGDIQNMKCNDGNWNYVAICTEGASNNGTNVTIIIKDKVEVYVSTFQYSGPMKVSVVTPVTERLVDYDVIDDSEWRMGPPKKKNGTSINFNISNSTISVLSNDSIFFRDD